MLAEVFEAAKYANPYRKHDGKNVRDLFPQIFDDDDEYIEEPAISEDEEKELQEEMAALNARGEAF